MEDRLLFSQRQELRRQFEQWARDNEASPTTHNFVSFLQSFGMINVTAAKEYLKERKSEDQ